MTMANATSSTHRPSPSASLRKTNKPLMEKRRRARINDSLTQLKTLVMTNSKKDSSSFNKLEKADILELTVNHLRDLQGKQQQQTQMSQNVGQDPAKYRAGFMECANEVICFLKQSQGFNDETKAKVVRHLAGCLQLNSQQTTYNRPTAAATIVQQNTAAPRPAATAQLVNGQIIQIVNTPFQQNQAPIQQTSAPAAMLVSSSAQQQIIPTQVVSQKSEPQHEQSSFNRFCQPLHIQIPPTKFPLLVKAPAQQQQVLAVRNIEERIPVPSKIDSMDSSCPSSPFSNNSSPPSKSSAHKHLDFYAPTELHNDYLSRSRTFSMTSSSSSESDMMSPLNLSQSPPFCYNDRPAEIIRPVASHKQDIAMDIPVQSSQNYASVIKNTRKALDIPSAKYMRMMMEEEQRQQSVSPASSMGEERGVWRPW